MQQQDKQFTMNDAFWFLYRLANAHATCFAVFTRDCFGCEALGWNGVFALVMLLFLLPIQGMIPFFGLWFIAIVVQRIRTLRYRRQGVRVHSMDPGVPWLALKFTKSHAVAVTVVEPAIVGAAGAVISLWSDGLGTFVMLGAASLLVRTGIEQLAARMRVQRMIDANIEGTWYGARYRGD